MHQPIEVDIVVIGGGWTGVSAALALHRYNMQNPTSRLSFAVLEGDRNRLGGRAFSFRHTWNNENAEATTFFEHGAQYLGKKQSAIWQLVQDAITTGIISNDALVDGYAARFRYREQVMVIAGRRYQYDRDACLFDIGGVPRGLGLWDLLGAMALIQATEAIEQSVNVLEPWRSPPSVTALDTITMQQWIDAFGLPPGARSLINVAVQAILSVSASEISALYFFWYCACNQGFLNLVNDEKDGPQQYYLACGFSALVDGLVAPFRSQIHLDHVVTHILHDDADVVTITTNRGLFRAKKAILALSPASSRSIGFLPALPSGWQTFVDQSMGTTIKCQLFYKSPWWRNLDAQEDPLRHDAPQYSGYCGANDSPVIWVMDNSPVGPGPEYKARGCYCLMTFTIGRQAQELLQEDPSKKTFVDYVTRAVCDLLNDARALSTSSEFEKFECFVWDKNTRLIPGGPNTVLAPGVLTNKDIAWIFDHAIGKKIVFACADLACKPISDRVSDQPHYVPNSTSSAQRGVYSDWRQSLGYVDGALLAGRFAVQCILAELRPAALPNRLAISSIPENFTDQRPQENTSMQTNRDQPPVPLTEEQIIAVLRLFCEKVHAGTELHIDKWNDNHWENDASALQIWVVSVMVQALIETGLLDPPPLHPERSDPSQVDTHFAKMAQWEEKFLAVMVQFVATGYGFYRAFQPSQDPYNPTTNISQVVELTKLANAIMLLKSSEPFQPARSQTPRRRLLSATMALRRALLGEKKSMH